MLTIAVLTANAVTSLLKIVCSCNPFDVLTHPKDVRTSMKALVVLCGPFHVQLLKLKMTGRL